MYKLISILLLVWGAQIVSGETDTLDNKEKGRFWDAWEKLVQVFKHTTDKQAAQNRDPWESWNRKVFVFNDVADRWILSPVAHGYQWITPDQVEKGIGNVFSNLFGLNVIVNDVLQLKIAQAASDSGRFLVNTTIGIGGIFDVATPMGLEKNQEDFGQTLGKWGVSSGPYVIVPIMGSYTLRSGVGAIGDSSLDAVAAIAHVPTRNQILFLRIVNKRAKLFAAESLITGDRYTFIRDAYLQHRDFLVNDGALEDNFGDEDFDDWEE